MIYTHNDQNDNKQQGGGEECSKRKYLRVKEEIFKYFLSEHLRGAMCQTTKNSFVFSTLNLIDTNEQKIRKQKYFSM